MAEGSRFTPFNPVAAYNRGVDRARADRAYEAEQRRNAFLSEAFKRYTNPATGEVDRNALLGAASQAGYGPESLGLTKQFQEIEEGEQKNVKAREENFASRLENRKALLPLMADSQEGWETWIDQTVRDVPELAPYQNMVDRTYSPQAVEKAMMNLDQVLQATYTLADAGDRTELLRTRPFGTRPPESVMTLNKGVDPNEASRAARAATAQPGGAGYKPRYGTVVDPANPLQTLAVDLNVYEPGATLGDPGVRGIATTSTLDAKTRAAREKAYPKVTASLRSFETKTENLIKLMESLKSDPGLDRIIGPIQARTPTMTKTAGTAEAKLKQIFAQGQFRELQEMRANSPTGGALGNVSNFEVLALQNAFAALDPMQSEESFRRSLDLAIQQLRDSTNIVRQSYEDEYDYRLGGSETSSSGPSIDDLLQKYQD